MSKSEGFTIGPAKKKERTVALKTLTQGNVFRLPGLSFEEAIGGDDAGGCFYYVCPPPKEKKEKEGLVRVMSVDWKVERNLPEETSVHSHHISIGISPSS